LLLHEKRYVLSLYCVCYIKYYNCGHLDTRFCFIDSRWEAKRTGKPFNDSRCEHLDTRCEALDSRFSSGRRSPSFKRTNCEPLDCVRSMLDTYCLIPRLHPLVPRLRSAFRRYHSRSSRLRSTLTRYLM